MTPRAVFMSEPSTAPPATPPAPAPPANADLEGLRTLVKSNSDTVAELVKTVDTLSKTPQYPRGFNPGMFAGKPPNVTSQLGEKPYSLMKAFAFATNRAGYDSNRCV